MPNVAVIECIPCACAIPVSLICCQLVGVKTYIQLYEPVYVCYCASLIAIPPSTQYTGICCSCNMIIDIHGCSIVLALLVNEALTIAASLTVPGFVHKYGVRGVQCVEVSQQFVCYFPSPSACTQYQHTHTHFTCTHYTCTQHT